MEPFNIVLSNFTGAQLIVFLLLAVIFFIGLQIAMWFSIARATKRMCEMVRDEHDEQRRMLAAIFGPPPMSDPLPPEEAPREKPPGYVGDRGAGELH